MIRNTEDDVIGTKPQRAPDYGELFAHVVTPAASTGYQRQHSTTATARKAPVRDGRTLMGEPTGPGAGELIKPRLLPHLLEFAKTRVNHRPPGFTADDVRQLAIEHHLITGHERGQRVYSWIGPWLKSLSGKGVIRPLLYTYGKQVERSSKRDNAHGNSQLVYTDLSDLSKIAP